LLECVRTMAIPRRKRPRLATTLDPRLLDRLRAHSEAIGEPLGRLIDRAMRKLLANEERTIAKQGEAA